jgi:hypothetical protein
VRLVDGETRATHAIETAARAASASSVCRCIALAEPGVDSSGEASAISVALRDFWERKKKTKKTPPRIDCLIINKRTVYL